MSAARGVEFWAWGYAYTLTAVILGTDDYRYSLTKDNEPVFTRLTLGEARRLTEGLVGHTAYRTTTAMMADALSRAEA